MVAAYNSYENLLTPILLQDAGRIYDSAFRSTQLAERT